MYYLSFGFLCLWVIILLLDYRDKKSYLDYYDIEEKSVKMLKNYIVGALYLLVKDDKFKEHITKEEVFKKQENINDSKS